MAASRINAKADAKADAKIDLRLEAIKARLLDDQRDTPFVIGEKVFVRTVTYHWTGRLLAIKGGFLILEDAAWIADSGRFADAIKSGELSEVEPVEGVVRVNLDALVDVCCWTHDLPRKQK